MDNGKVTVWVGTKKGAFALRPNGSRAGAFTLEGPHLLGCLIYHVVQDPRDSQRLQMATAAGHLGPTVHRSDDGGKTWAEAARPAGGADRPRENRGRVIRRLSPTLPMAVAGPPAPGRLL